MSVKQSLKINTIARLPIRPQRSTRHSGSRVFRNGSIVSRCSVIRTIWAIVLLGGTKASTDSSNVDNETLSPCRTTA